MRFLSLSLAGAVLAAGPTGGSPAMNLHAFTVNTLDGRPKALADFKGKVVLVVNVASECGYTPQYAGLQKLYEAHRARGLEVLGFPCNQFGAQEPGSAAQIQAFCSKNYGVTFPLFEKVDVKGSRQAPLFAFLADGHGEPKWNFHKYLVGKDGRVRKAFPSKVAPDSPELLAAIAEAMK